jgi:hypothetical protein
MPNGTYWLYLTASGECSGPGGNEPCFSNNDPYIFSCAGAASTPQGCTQKVTSTLVPAASYTINILYPFVNGTTEKINQIEPSAVNCLWTVQGGVPGQGYAHCISLTQTSFVMATPGVAPATGSTGNIPTMTVNGSLYYSDDITSDITIGFPGYSFFHNSSVTFLGVKFETDCPPSYGGCPVPPGVTETTVTTMMIGAIRLNATFADKSTESISALIGDDDYIFAFTHHTGPQAGVLIVYSGGFKAYLLVS